MTNKEKIYNILDIEPRIKWKELISPLLESVYDNCSYVDAELEPAEDPYCSFTPDILDVNYTFEFNIGDKVLCNEEGPYIIKELPPLDSRNKNKYSGIEICQRGSSYILVNMNGSETDLYYEDTNFKNIQRV